MMMARRTVLGSGNPGTFYFVKDAKITQAQNAQVLTWKNRAIFEDDTIAQTCFAVANTPGFIGVNRNLHTKGGRRVRGLFSLTMAALMLLGCDNGREYRPNNGRSSFGGSTSMKPVQVDLYIYAPMRPTSIWDYIFHPNSMYIIVDQPPLSFKFPSAYYFRNSNHDGGPQSAVWVEFDKETMLPDIYAPYHRHTKNPLRPISPVNEPERYAERGRRRVSVFLEANSQGLLPKDYDPSDSLRQAVERNGRNRPFEEPLQEIKNITVVNGFNIVEFYRESIIPLKTDVDPPVMVEGVDIANREIKVFPINREDHIVRYIHCSASQSRCSAKIVYHRRLMTINFSKEEFRNIDFIAKKQ